MSYKVSINILTKNRAELFKKALLSVEKQSFKDYEVIVVNDGSSDETERVLQNFQFPISNFQIINHPSSLGITKSRQEALEKSTGEYIAILDDDDEWIDTDKLAKQVKYLDEHKECVLVGGGRVDEISNQIKNPNGKNIRLRLESDQQIRKTMLFRNNFFTSTVMFRREVAIRAGGFISDADDFGEDYDLWLRMGKLGKMYNFPQAFTHYTVPNYNKLRFKAFLSKQLRLIKREKSNYLLYYFASVLLKLRLHI